MDMMFTIPGNTLLVIGLGIVLGTIGFVIYGFIKGWKNVMPDYDKMKEELTIDG
jgi:ABC-type anion transport system duplicated permease subunit